jgi:ATP adenylyltransferase/5',5'''-P-1,P-4-tetraphosphate phosphorylase II
MMIIPRRADRVFHGVSFNSLGMLGSMAIPLAKEGLVEEVKELGYMKLLADLCYPENI